MFNCILLISIITRYINFKINKEKETLNENQQN